MAERSGSNPALLVVTSACLVAVVLLAWMNYESLQRIEALESRLGPESPPYEPIELPYAYRGEEGETDPFADRPLAPTPGPAPDESPGERKRWIEALDDREGERFFGDLFAQTVPGRAQLSERLSDPFAHVVGQRLRVHSRGSRGRPRTPASMTG